ncbi:MAG: class I SAM-dependent methyltransferase [Coxiellaceae bacterium]|jgi:ubiquinone/menaquinone biosynthesis C-methylase UbiE|nr:class I SAM-dependent methyltransferase [Coxiellaceae bacterium]
MRYNQVKGARNITQSRLMFWNARANLAFRAGTNDTIAKQLEIINILKLLKGCKYVLDAGCGNGITAISICKSMRNVHMYAFDYSEAMITEARKLSLNSGCSKIIFEVGELTKPPFKESYFDAVYTERSLINLNNLNEQKISVSALLNKVRKGGILILCESFNDGLQEINIFRNALGVIQN